MQAFNEVNLVYIGIFLIYDFGLCQETLMRMVVQWHDLVVCGMNEDFSHMVEKKRSGS